MLWEPKRRIEAAFRKNLLNIAREIIKQVGNITDTDVITEILRQISKSREFEKFSESAAMKMVTHLFDDQGHTWRQATAANGKGGSFYAALQAELRGYTGRLLMDQVKRNAEIIKTLPLDISIDVTTYISQETAKGRRASEIAKEIKLKFPEQTKARAKLIARTEVSKTQSQLTESRCRMFNINWYVWRPVGGSKGDGRTRKSHRGMADVLVAWDDAPAPEDLFPQVSKITGKRYRNSLGHYHAGCCPNCRCYAEPVIDLDLFTWPMQAYRNGSIQRINRKAFEKII